MKYVRLIDFETKELVGTTHGSANTQRLFRHAFNILPAFVMVQEGNIYIPKEGTGPNEIDIRSSNTNEEFKILLFF